MANSIDFPTETKWFITYNDEEVIMSWGDVTPDETMTTGQPVLTTFDNEEDWSEVLIENGINPYPDAEDEEDEEPVPPNPDDFEE
jgi:hypothetical protein